MNQRTHAEWWAEQAALIALSAEKSFEDVTLCAVAAAIEGARDAALYDEHARWQKRIEEVIARLAGGPIPAGVGAESGDPLDDAVAMIEWLHRQVDERLDDALADYRRVLGEKRAAEGLLAECDACGATHARSELERRSPPAGEGLFCESCRTVRP